MKVANIVNIDLAIRQNIPFANAVQGDSARSIELRLFENATPFEIPAGAAILIRYKRSDGAVGAYNALPDGSIAYSATGNTLTIQLAPQMLAVVGETLMQVSILSGEKTLSTFAVSICVQEDITADVIAPEDYVNLIPIVEVVEECDVTLTGEQYFFEGGGFCYTTVGNDGEITSSDGRPSPTNPGIASGTFRCVKGSTLIVYKWNGMPAKTYTASTTGEVTELVSVSTTGYTIIVFRVDGDGTITLT